MLGKGKRVSMVPSTESEGFSVKFQRKETNLKIRKDGRQ
jgi:hypothetical protein